MKDQILNILEDYALSILEKNKLIDSLFGIDYSAIESGLCDFNICNAYINQLEVDGLNTAYSDIYQLISLIEYGTTIVDVGAGYCRLALFISVFRPDIHIICIDFIASRMKNAKNFITKNKISNVVFINQDISHVILKQTINYFFFYFPVCDELKIFLRNNLKKNHSLIAIESHGDFFDFIENELIGYESCYSIPLSIQRHHNELRIYKLINQKELIEFENYFYKLLNKIKENRSCDFNHQSLRLSSFVFIRMKEYKNIKIIFKNGEAIDLKSLHNSYFNQYQLETCSPRRVYKYSDVLKFTL